MIPWNAGQDAIAIVAGGPSQIVLPFCFVLTTRARASFKAKHLKGSLCFGDASGLVKCEYTQESALRNAGQDAQLCVLSSWGESTSFHDVGADKVGNDEWCEAPSRHFL